MKATYICPICGSLLEWDAQVVPFCRSCIEPMTKLTQTQQDQTDEHF